jgi:DNA invertase Pin-like site-specific DNA recombinase
MTTRVNDATGEHTPFGVCSFELDGRYQKYQRYLMSKRIRLGNPLVAVGIVRVSTDRQELGPVAQAAALDRWAVSQGVELVAVFLDLGVSGATPVHERAGLVGALATLRELGAGTLVAAKRDRLARDTAVMATLEGAVRASGAVIRTADGASDGDADDEGAFVRRSVDDMISVLERMKIRARTRAALAIKKARGELVGAAPYGSRLSADGVRIEADEAEQGVIAAVRELQAAGLSQRAIAAQLAARGLVSRAGTAFGQTQVARMLRKTA